MPWIGWESDKISWEQNENTQSYKHISKSNCIDIKITVLKENIKGRIFRFLLLCLVLILDVLILYLRSQAF